MKPTKDFWNSLGKAVVILVFALIIGSALFGKAYLEYLDKSVRCTEAK